MMQKLVTTALLSTSVFAVEAPADDISTLCVYGDAECSDDPTICYVKGDANSDMSFEFKDYKEVKDALAGMLVPVEAKPLKDLDAQSVDFPLLYRSYFCNRKTATVYREQQVATDDADYEEVFAIGVLGASGPRDLNDAEKATCLESYDTDTKFKGDKAYPGGDCTKTADEVSIDPATGKYVATLPTNVLKDVDDILHCNVVFVNNVPCLETSGNSFVVITKFVLPVPPPVRRLASHHLTEVEMELEHEMEIKHEAKDVAPRALASENCKVLATVDSHTIVYFQFATLNFYLNDDTCAVAAKKQTATATNNKVEVSKLAWPVTASHSVPSCTVSSDKLESGLTCWDADKKALQYVDSGACVFQTGLQHEECSAQASDNNYYYVNLGAEASAGLVGVAAAMAASAIAIRM